jgi:hypothetical protein
VRDAPEQVFRVCSSYSVNQKQDLGHAIAKIRHSARRNPVYNGTSARRGDVGDQAYFGAKTCWLLLFGDILSVLDELTIRAGTAARFVSKPLIHQQ